MDNNSITSLAQELKISEDLARMALGEAGGLLEKAREILSELLPRYLIIKVKYLSQKSGSGGGLIFICLEKGSGEYVYFKALSDTERDWLNSIVVRHPPELFFRCFQDFFREHKASSHAYDSQKLSSDLAAIVSPQNLAFAFDEWIAPKQELILDPKSSETENVISIQLSMIFEKALADHLMQRIEAEVDYDFYTPQKFDLLREMLGLAPPEKKAADESVAAREADERFKIYFKGQFIIDPVTGTSLEEIKVGDFAYCDVLDRSEVAVAAARLIGAYKRGMWHPIRGVIAEIEDMVGDRRKYRLKLAPGVYADVLSFVGFRIRTSSIAVNRIVVKSRQAPQKLTLVPLIFAVILAAALVMSLLVMR